ncbi:MAG TPA: AI-2E family transporter [Acidimicrobiales bacterium]|nr:AI-2E family transporter [Acidimicrobiales bacterium]
MALEPARRPVPVRTILATIGLVLATIVAIAIVQKLANVIGLLVVALFFAILLTPPVDFLERHRMRRSLATIVVFLSGVVLFSLMIAAFVQPIAREVDDFIENFPTFVEDAREGRGPIGRVVTRFEIDTYIEENQDQLERQLRGAGAPALDVARSVASGVFTFVTILVLSFLMILEGPQITAGILRVIDDGDRRERLRKVAADCSKAVTGYMAGNLVISVIAGVTTFVFLSIIGVPFAGVLGLWVAFADLIPLVGATLGAIPTIAVAFLSSPTDGIAAVIFYVVYQQFENHLLQPTVMSRTVDINPLGVLVSVLVGVDLFGILGALLAIPAAGVLQVIVRNLYDEHRGRLKPVPTVGTDEIPITEADDGE